MKYYDQQNNRLVYFKERMNLDFWDDHWQKHRGKYVLKSPPMNKFIAKTTKRYLPPGSKVLEGGCGIGNKLNSLSKIGYEVYGIDTAGSALLHIKKNLPELKVIIADVRELPFKNSFFNGSFSLGVIEHFFEGFDNILKETKRTLVAGGYLFLSFPTMSMLRKIKVKMNSYPSFDEKANLNDFYQFVVDPKNVLKILMQNGFKLVKEKNLSGLKGLKDEISFLKPLLQKIYDGNSIFSKSLRIGLELILSRLTGHMKLMVFQKED